VSKGGVVFVDALDQHVQRVLQLRLQTIDQVALTSLLDLGGLELSVERTRLDLASTHGRNQRVGTKGNKLDKQQINDKPASAAETERKKAPKTIPLRQRRSPTAK
jgi:hypothetical protein